MQDQQIASANQDANVFQYENYREFLKNYYTKQKNKYPNRFSYRYFSKMAGFARPGFLHDIITGKRNLSHESLKKVAKVIKLNTRENAYFETLVLYNQSKNDDDRAFQFKKMISMQGFKNEHVLTEEQSKILLQWYCPVILKMVHWKSFKICPSWIASCIQPKIEVAEAEQALKLLRDLRFIKIDSKGRSHLSYPNYKTQAQGTGELGKKYHKKMISLALECLERPASERNVTGSTLSLSRAKFEIVRQEIEEFNQRINQIIALPISKEDLKDTNPSNNVNTLDRDNCINGVYQLNIQLFKVAGDQEKLA